MFRRSEPELVEEIEFTTMKMALLEDDVDILTIFLNHPNIDLNANSKKLKSSPDVYFSEEESTIKTALDKNNINTICFLLDFPKFAESLSVESLKELMATVDDEKLKSIICRNLLKRNVS